MKLSEAQKMLDATDCVFYKVHRCYIVSLMHVRKFTAAELFLDNGEVLPIARSAAAAFKDKMFLYLKQNGR